MGILTNSEGGLPLNDDWVRQLTQLNLHLNAACQRMGSYDDRRRFLTASVGKIRPLRHLDTSAIHRLLQEGALVGVDGSVNTFGSAFPHYVDFMRAVAKPTRGEPIVLKNLHCPFTQGGEESSILGAPSHNEVRQEKLAELEVQAALVALDRLNPRVLLMDGPLIRFEMRTPQLFSQLRYRVLQHKVLLAGCIENIESKVIQSVAGAALPAPWRGTYDRDLLWGVLEYAEVLEVSQPAKGTALSADVTGSPEESMIRTWFLRSSLDPGVIGVDLLEEQAGSMGALADLLFTLSPPDGRGIPVWLDIVDREVRLTNQELDAYLEVLDPRVRWVFSSKREMRIF